MGRPRWWEGGGGAAVGGPWRRKRGDEHDAAGRGTSAGRADVRVAESHLASHALA